MRLWLVGCGDDGVGVGLPAFFQNNAKTVVAGLEDFELESGNQGGDGLDALIDEDNANGLNDDTFGDAEVLEYDENPENLPDFFKLNKPVTTAPPPVAIPQIAKSAPPGLPPGLTPQKKAGGGEAPAAATSATPSNAYFSSPASFLSPSGGLAGSAASAPAGVQVSAASSAALFGAIAGGVRPAAAAAPSTPVSAAPALSFAAATAGGVPHTPRSLFEEGTSTPQRDLFAAAPSTPSSSLFPGTPSLSSVTQALPETPTQPVHQRVTEYLGRGKYMTASDVRYVVSRVLQPLETVDPYADDFYHIQVSGGSG